jgi:hypothetical protein
MPRLRPSRVTARDDRNAIAFFLAQLADKGAVDLDLVEREAAQIAERGIVCAEIVHRNLRAEFAHLVQHVEHRAVVLQQHGFGDLTLKPRRRQAGSAERADHRERQRRIAG